MLKRIQLSNFKSWRNLDLELAPITVLFGTNSSGKSSVLQSLLLIKQSIEYKDVNFGNDKQAYVRLGSFQDIVFNHDLQLEISIILELALNDSIHFSGDHIDTFTIKYVENRVVLEEDSVDTFWSLVMNHDYLHYLGPLRLHPERVYLWSGVVPSAIEPDGGNTIAALIASQRLNGKLHEQVSTWLKDMKLVDDFNVSPVDNNQRFYDTNIRIGDKISSLLHVGFGVSQVLPVITLLFFAPEGSLILLEQPELHLHPGAQAQLADLILHVAKERNLQLVIESHSEHLLRRFQRRIAEIDQEFASPENIKMYFCEAGAEGSQVQEVKVDAYGQIENWPKNFFGDVSGDLDAMMQAGIERRLKELNGG